MEYKRRQWAERRERIKDLFDLHRGERRGVLALMMLLTGSVGWVIYEQWLRPPKEYDLSVQRERIEAWIASRSGIQGDSVPLNLFPFDPNAIDREGWRALGLTDKQVDGIERYQSKGGHFRTKRDLGRMYSIKPEQFALLEPYIQLPDSLPGKGHRRYERPPTGRDERRNEVKDGSDREGPMIREPAHYASQMPRSVEVNTADTAALIALPGVGPAFARGIVKYRDLLGGFVSLDQLGEVYVLRDKPDAVLKLKQLLILDTLAVIRIPINTCTVEQLAAHPYVRWKIAKPVIAYRDRHGPFEQLVDLQGCAAIDAEVFRKLAPYLSLE
ncbi:MAG: helix-hairpin-helix domain-containing protein [Flavobacteriales bacterium]|nr:helix-hairpin-helix domain-containing protein [Flavobacteriales bacterium]